MSASMLDIRIIFLPKTGIGIGPINPVSVGEFFIYPIVNKFN